MHKRITILALIGATAAVASLSIVASQSGNFLGALPRRKPAQTQQPTQRMTSSASSTKSISKTSAWRNPLNPPEDVDNNLVVTKADWDALTQYLNDQNTAKTVDPKKGPTPRYPDVDGDGVVSVSDANLVATYLSARANGEAGTRKSPWQKSSAPFEDVNVNTAVTRGDFDAIQRYIDGPQPKKLIDAGPNFRPNPRYPDVNGDWVVNSADLLLIGKMITGN